MILKLKNLISICSLMILISTSAFSVSVPIYDLHQGKYIGKNLKIVKSDSDLTIQEAIKRTDYIDSTTDIPRFGYISGDFWAKLEIVNSSNTSEIVLFEVHGPIEKMDMYIVSDAKILNKQHAGMMYTPSEESFDSNHIYPVFKAVIPPGISTVYFNPDAIAPHFPIIAHSLLSFDNSSKKQYFYINLYVGVFAFLLILLTIFLVMTKGKWPFLLLFSFVGYFALAGFVNGIFRYIYSNLITSSSIFLNLYLTLYKYWTFSLGLYMVSLSLYALSRHKDRLEKQVKYLKIFTLSCVFGQFLLAPVSLIDIRISMNSFACLFILTIFQTIIWAIKDFRDNISRKEKAFEIFGLATYAIFSSLQLFFFLGLTQNKFFASWGTNIGFFILICCLIIALMIQLNHDLFTAKENYRTSLNELKENFIELKKRDEIIKVFVDPVINTELSLYRNPIEFKPRIVDYTVMFFDMRGFTAKMENLNEDELINFSGTLNNYVQTMIDIIVGDGGHVQKIIGDAIMCNFNDTNKCMAACQKIRTTLSMMNKERVSNNLYPIKFGTGLSAGKVINTNLGSKNIKLDRTILGNVVNQSAKIESLTKLYEVDVLLDQSIFDKISNKNFIRWVGREKVGGKSEFTDLYEYYGHNADEVIKLKNSSLLVLENIKQGYQKDNVDPVLLQQIHEAIHLSPKHSYHNEKIKDQSLIHIRNNLMEYLQNRKVI